MTSGFKPILTATAIALASPVLNWAMPGRKTRRKAGKRGLPPDFQVGGPPPWYPQWARDSRYEDDGDTSYSSSSSSDGDQDSRKLNWAGFGGHSQLVRGAINNDKGWTRFFLPMTIVYFYFCLILFGWLMAWWPALRREKKSKKAKVRKSLKGKKDKKEKDWQTESLYLVVGLLWFEGLDRKVTCLQPPCLHMPPWIICAGKDEEG